MSTNWKIVSSGPWNLPGWEVPLLEAGCEVVSGVPIETSPGITYDERQLIDLFEGADAVIASSRDVISRRVLERCPRLKIVAKSSVGVDLIAFEAAAELGILVVNSPARENIIGVAEATVGLMVALNKKLIANQKLVHDGLWKRSEHLGETLAGRTIGIIGLGRIGMNVARRLAGWDVRILACDPYVDPAVAYALGAELTGLDDLLRSSDVVTLHVPANEETRRLIDEARLRVMKPSALLINTSRGAVVDSAALGRALREHTIAGAALDVFETEPLPAESELRAIDASRLILTPHAIGTNIAMQATGTRMAVNSILQVMRGELPRHVINQPASTGSPWRFRGSNGGQYAT